MGLPVGYIEKLLLVVGGLWRIPSLRSDNRFMTVSFLVA